MKKKLISFVLAMVVLAVNLSAFASANDSAALLETGYNNVPFSNGYTGFCIDRDKTVGYGGNEFTVSDTDSATNNLTGADISQYLKILFVDHFEELFVSDGNGGYVIASPAFAQGYVYAFTDRDSSWWDYEPLTSVVNAYNNGRRIPDSGEKINVDNVTVTFDFMVLLSTRTDIEQQDFFAFKLTVGPQEHVHDFSGEWQKDDTNHWKQCSCDETDQLDAHSGGTAICSTGAVCTTCGKEYTNVDLQNHVGETELRGYKEATEFEEGYSGDVYCLACSNLITEGEILPATHEHNFGEEWKSGKESHWHECSCGDYIDFEKHEFKDDKCVVCQSPDPSGMTPDTGSDFDVWVLLGMTAVSAIGLVVFKRRDNMI